jgi:hypothetical protein
MLLSKRSWILWLLPLTLESCVSAPMRRLPAVTNCRMDPDGVFYCLKPDRSSYDILANSPDAQDLVCFPSLQFKAYNESCHQ